MNRKREILLMLSEKDKRKIKEIGKFINVSDREVIEYLLMREIYLYRYQKNIFDDKWDKAKGKIYRTNEKNKDKDCLSSRKKVEISENICMNIENIARLRADHLNKKQQMNYVITKLLNMAFQFMDKIEFDEKEKVSEETEQESKKKRKGEIYKNTYITTEWFDSMLKEMQELSGISASCICKFALFEFMIKYYFVLEEKATDKKATEEKATDKK